MRDYREILVNELEQRQLNNSNYSLRAFARDMGVGAGRLSEIMRGKQGLSREKARSLAAKLGFDEKGQQYFCNLVDIQHARSALERQRALKQLEKEDNLNSIQQIKEELRFLSQWYDFAIRRLTQVKGFKSDPEWIAHRLGIETKEATEAIERLLGAGLLERDSNDNLLFSDNLSSGPQNTHPEYEHELRQLYEGFFARAVHARFTQPLDRRDHSAHVFAINYDQIPKLKEFIIKLADDLDAETYNSEEKDAVYCLSTQLFCLEENPPK